MSAVQIRSAVRNDLRRITEIYNYYVVNSPATFDLIPFLPENRVAWFEQFQSAGRHRLLVAEENGTVLGYTGTTKFRPKAGYENTVETTIYLAAEAAAKGVGTLLYSALFEAISGEAIRRIVAGYVLPNPASAKLHTRFGFTPVGTFTENGYKFERYWDVAWLERPLHPQR